MHTTLHFQPSRDKRLFLFFLVCFGLRSLNEIFPSSKAFAWALFEAKGDTGMATLRSVCTKQVRPGLTLNLVQDLPKGTFFLFCFHFPLQIAIRFHSICDNSRKVCCIHFAHGRCSKYCRKCWRNVKSVRQVGLRPGLKLNLV